VIANMDKNILVMIEPAAPPDVQAGFGAAFSPDRHKLVAADGTEIPLSDMAFAVVQQILPALEARRQTITIAPSVAELSPNQAADLLNVSRPYLMKLLKQGALPFVKIGAHHRIRTDDLQQYKAQRDRERRRSLTELTELMEEEGLFD
jgi:excisionase family DNA binding protein